MLDKIQTYEQKWESEGHEYLLKHARDNVKAHEEMLEDWVGNVSLDVWKYLQKTDGILWLSIDEIEDALAEADGDIDEALEQLRKIIHEEEDPREEALTNSERNPSLVGRYHG